MGIGAHFNVYNAQRFFMTTPQTLTQLLSAWSNGDKAALEQLMPMVSPNTVLREWRIAKAWLHRELSDPVAASPTR